MLNFSFLLNKLEDVKALDQITTALSIRDVLSNLGSLPPAFRSAFLYAGNKILPYLSVIYITNLFNSHLKSLEYSVLSSLFVF